MYEVTSVTELKIVAEIFGWGVAVGLLIHQVRSIAPMKKMLYRHNDALLLIAASQQDNATFSLALQGLMKSNPGLNVAKVREILAGGKPVPEWALAVFRDIVNSNEPIESDMDIYVAVGSRVRDVPLKDIRAYGLTLSQAVAIMGWCIKRARSYGEGGADRLLREIGAIQ